MINFIALFLKKESLRSFDMRKIFQAFKWHLLFSLLLIHWWVIDMHLIFFYSPKKFAIFILIFG